MTIKHVYLYIVTFVTLMMTIGGCIGFIMSVADYTNPVTYTETFSDYVENRSYDDEGERVPVTLKDEERLRAMYDDMVIQEEKRDKKFAANGMVKSLAWVLIPLPLFWMTRRHLKKMGTEKA